MEIKYCIATVKSTRFVDFRECTQLNEEVANSSVFRVLEKKRQIGIEIQAY